MKKKITLSIGSDHAGYTLKEFIKSQINDVRWVDEGTLSLERVDYPDYAHKVALKVVSKRSAGGVLVCGSGIGMSISANKIKGIRAAVVESEVAARLSKQHNNSNVLCLGARILAPEYAKEIVTAWLNSKFEGGRHEDRISKISKLEGVKFAKARRKRKS